jgi:hypothetical protein
VKETDTTLGTDPALQQAFGLLACPDQSTFQGTLDAATPENVVELRSIIWALFLGYSLVVSRLAGGQRVRVDIGLTPLPASARAERPEQGYLGREGSKTGRKLLRVRITPEQGIIYQRVVSGKAASGFALLQEAVTQMERVLGLTTPEQRALVVVRLDSGFGARKATASCSIEAITCWGSMS